MRVTVDVDVEDVFYQVSDDALLKELEHRGSQKSRQVDDAERSALDALLPLIEEALAQLQQGRADDARLTLERSLYPKWKTFESSAAECLRALKAEA